MCIGFREFSSLARAVRLVFVGSVDQFAFGINSMERNDEEM